MGAQMWLSYDSDKKSMQFPVLPEKVTISHGSKDEKVYVYGVGGTLLNKLPDAKVIKFESFFPKTRCQGCVPNPIAPRDAYSFLSAVQHLPGCARFLYCGGATSHGFNCRISYEVWEEAGDIGTIYYSITITKVNSITFRKIKTQASSATKSTTTTTTAKKTSETTGRASTNVKSRTYTVVKGDCLWNIAKKYYGNGSRYTDIIAANKNVFSGKRANSTVIYVGDVLVIP